MAVRRSCLLVSTRRSFWQVAQSEVRLYYFTAASVPRTFLTLPVLPLSQNSRVLDNICKIIW